MNERISAELELLRSHFADLQYDEEGRWVLLPRYPAPAALWTKVNPDVVFQIPMNYPEKPYAFYVRAPFSLVSGAEPQNVTESGEPPFGERWLKFSWDLPEWQATADLRSGYNLLNWALSFRRRLEEGA